MKPVYLLLIFPTILFSQSKKIYLLDKNKHPVNRFTVIIYHKQDSIIYTNKKNDNYFNLQRKFDSIKINYNLFYSKKIIKKHFKKIDTIFLKEEVSLNEIEIHNKIKEISTNGKLRTFGTSPDSQGLLRIDISKYKDYSIEYINFFFFNKYKNPFVTKKYLYNKNMRFELLLFQSNDENPNGKNIPLLSKSFIVEIGEIDKKEWLKLDIRKLDINIKDYKYLYIGHKNLNNYIGIGYNKIKDNKEIKPFYRTTSAYTWLHLKWRTGRYIPAIKIGLKE